MLEKKYSGSGKLRGERMSIRPVLARNTNTADRRGDETQRKQRKREPPRTSGEA